jgi:dolichol-phosphate mannosyltransferase
MSRPLSRKSKYQQVVVVIPTYNEVANIAHLLKCVFSELPGVSIVVVDDQSPDGTAQVVMGLRQKYPTLHLLQGKSKAGRGQAVVRGLAHAYRQKFQVFIEMDADFSHRPEELRVLVATTQPGTAVFASRYIEGGRIDDWPWARRIFSLLANRLIAKTLGLILSDNTNGFRTYSRQAVKEILKTPLVCKSYLTLSEMALLLQSKGYELREVPAIFPNRKKGVSNTNLREIFNNLMELWRLRQHNARQLRKGD